MVELMFACRLTAPIPEPQATVPDPMQVGAAWIPIEQPDRYRPYPRARIPMLMGREVPTQPA